MVSHKIELFATVVNNAVLCHSTLSVMVRIIFPNNFSVELLTPRSPERDCIRKYIIADGISQDVVLE